MGRLVDDATSFSVLRPMPLLHINSRAAGCRAGGYAQRCSDREACTAVWTAAHSWIILGLCSICPFVTFGGQQV